MRIKFVLVILKIFLILSIIVGFTGEARGAEEKKTERYRSYKALSQPKKPEGAILQAADAFYWDNAVLEPGDTVYCNSNHESYWINLHEVSLNDTFIWRYYNPVKDSKTGLPTSAYELNAWMNWSYHGDYWEWVDDRFYNFKYYYPSNSGSFGAGIYIAGDEPEMYAGVWKVEIWRNHEGNLSLLTSTTFNLIDICPPNVWFGLPFNDAVLKGRVTVSVGALDNIKVSKVEVWADNTTTGQSYKLKEFNIADTSPYEFTWDTRQYPLGKYTLRARATDVYSNFSETQINVMTSAVVGVVRMDAINNVKLPGVVGPVFTGHFNEAGDIVQDSVQIVADYLNDSFDLVVYLDAYPARPAWEPIVKYKWQLWGGPNEGTFTGWYGVIHIPTDVRNLTERKLGEDQLKLVFEFYMPAGASLMSSAAKITGAAAPTTSPESLGIRQVIALGFFGVPKLEIILPAQKQDFDLTQNTYTSTGPINFQAKLTPSDSTMQINWEVNLNYRTTGGWCADCNDTRTFTTYDNEIHQETYTSMGGFLAITAYITYAGMNFYADPPGKATITGPLGIPPATITSRLVNLYGGATPNLMTGIAMRESTYQQFRTLTLYDRTDKWPNENMEGASYVGLMQVPISMIHAWDWQENAKDAVNLFTGDKMNTAHVAVRNMQRQYPGLRDLTAFEYENMALVLYGFKLTPDAEGPVQHQYYIVNSAGTDWVVNYSGCPGIGYVKFIRDNLQ